jgi:hypothetical protein
VDTWEAALRARAAGQGAEAEAAERAVAELESLRARLDAVASVVNHAGDFRTFLGFVQSVEQAATGRRPGDLNP